MLAGYPLAGLSWRRAELFFGLTVMSYQGSWIVKPEKLNRFTQPGLKRCICSWIHVILSDFCRSKMHHKYNPTVERLRTVTGDFLVLRWSFGASCQGCRVMFPSDMGWSTPSWDICWSHIYMRVTDCKYLKAPQLIPFQITTPLSYSAHTFRASKTIANINHHEFPEPIPNYRHSISAARDTF